MTERTAVTRREFIEATAAGTALVVGFSFSGCARGPSGPPVTLNSWVRVGEDDSVLIVVDKSEMGQGVATAIPQLVAEELEVDWESIQMEFAPAAPEYANPAVGLQATGGSTSIRASFVPMRKAGAQAREMLITAAAESWGVPAAECGAESGSVIHEGSGRSIRYGKLVAVAATMTPPGDPPLKDASAWKVVGKPIPRMDTPAKVDGSAEFGMDVSVPGMLTALVARCPVFGGTVASFDDMAARRVTGVRDVVQISNGVAVVGDGYWPAKKGRDALEITWDEGPNADVSSESI